MSMSRRSSLLCGRRLACVFDFRDAGLDHLRHERVRKRLVRGQLDRAFALDVWLQLSRVSPDDAAPHAVERNVTLPVGEVDEVLPVVLEARHPVADRFGRLRRRRFDRRAKLCQRGALVFRGRRDVLAYGLRFRGLPGRPLRGLSWDVARLLPAVYFCEARMETQTAKTFVAHVSATIDASRAHAWAALVDPETKKRYIPLTSVVSQWHENSPIVWKRELEGKAFEIRGTVLRFEPERLLEYSHSLPIFRPS